MKLLVVFVLISSQSSYGAKITNTGMEFLEATRNWDSLTDAERVCAWESFEKKYQKIYDKAIYRKNEKGWEKRVQEKRSAFFNKLLSIKPKMEKLFIVGPQLIVEKENEFRNLFSDFPTDIPVYLIPSLLSLNGQVRPLPNDSKEGLIIGIDFVVDRNDNLSVLFAHEFFHAYHETKIPKDTGATMATPLWKEGFATYVSGLLNQQEPDSVLLMDNELANVCKDNNYVVDLARLYTDIIFSDGATIYEDWYLMRGKTKPVRRGYCLGLKVIRIIAQDNDLKDMTTWNEKKYTDEMLKAFTVLINNQ